MGRHLAPLALIAIAILASGCTRVVVHEADGNIRIHNEFGVIELGTDPAQMPQIFKTEGFGVFTGADGIRIGYFNSETAMLPADDCRIVIWIDDNASPQLANRIAALGDAVCTVGPGAQLVTVKEWIGE